MSQVEVLDRWKEVVEIVRSGSPDWIPFLQQKIFYLEEAEPFLVEGNGDKTLELVFKAVYPHGVSSTSYRVSVENAVKEIFGEEVKTKFTLLRPRQDDKEEVSHLSPTPKSKGQLPLPISPAVSENGTGTLDPDLTLDNFVVGPSNERALKMVEMFVDSPNGNGNHSLTLIGDTGSGKTHLSEAIAHREKDKRRVLYMSTNQLIRKFMSASAKRRSGNYNDGEILLNELYRKMVFSDLLILEGIHALVGKEKTQLFLLPILEERERRAGKKTIITSVVFPESLNSFDKELKSRLEGGWRANLNPLDKETRRNISFFLSRKFSLSLDEKSLTLLSEVPVETFRQMESVLANIKVARSIKPYTPVSEVVEETLDLYHFYKGKLTLENIMGEVCLAFKTEQERVVSKSRKAVYSLSRQAFCYLAREITDKTLQEIGEFIGRSHSTVKYEVDKIESEMKCNKNLHLQIEHIKGEIIKKR